MRRLLIRPGGIGDCILSLPALEHLKADYTEVWVRSEIVPLIRFADRVCSIASTGLDLLGLPGVEPPPGVLERLRSFDSIVSWYGANRPEFCEQVRALGLPCHFLSALPSRGETVHAADFFLRQAGGTGTAIPRIECVPKRRRDGVVIHPFSGSARKNWPLELYREVAQGLPFAVQWCAGPEELLEGAVRIENLWDLARWLAGARLYIGNDSGITHLAAAVGTPVVAVFIASDAQVWSPRGPHVTVLDGCDLKPEQILKASLDLTRAIERATIR
ncbi:MAG TPA: glycosyltransferase family 9 protein [Bryobacteraceae bacterium]|nr:glycosyltransferase family 9 protein [Bryobacteraceae bacterium]